MIPFEDSPLIAGMIFSAKPKATATASGSTCVITMDIVWLPMASITDLSFSNRFLLPQALLVGGL